MNRFLQKIKDQSVIVVYLNQDKSSSCFAFFKKEKTEKVSIENIRFKREWPAISAQTFYRFTVNIPTTIYTG